MLLTLLMSCYFLYKDCMTNSILNLVPEKKFFSHEEQITVSIRYSKLYMPLFLTLGKNLPTEFKVTTF